MFVALHSRRCNVIKILSLSLPSCIMITENILAINRRWRNPFDPSVSRSFRRSKHSPGEHRRRAEKSYRAELLRAQEKSTYRGTISRARRINLRRATLGPAPPFPSLPLPVRLSPRRSLFQIGLSLSRSGHFAGRDTKAKLPNL